MSGTGRDRLSVLVEGLDHPEGVTTTRDGTLYAGGEAGQVYRIDGDKPVEIANSGGFMLGLCADGNGILYCCDVGRREVLRIDPKDGSIAVYSSGTAFKPMVNPNWPVFDDDGNLYVTDSGHFNTNDGCIFKITCEGETNVWSDATTNFPNGAALSADGRSLLVLESTTPALVRIPIEQDGSAGAREVVAELPDTVPDGIALDTEGRAYVFYYRPDRIDRVWPDGSVELLADDPQGTILAAPTNGVWLEPERTKLVVGSLGRWHLTLCDFGAAGVPLRYPELP